MIVSTVNINGSATYNNIPGIIILDYTPVVLPMNILPMKAYAWLVVIIILL